MKVFVGEFICGGGLAGTPVSDIPPSLRAEGRAMLESLCTDCAKVAETHTALDERLRIDLSSDTNPSVFSGTGDYSDHWLALARSCDASILIAPETGRTLATCVSKFRDAGVNLIACPPEFIEVAANKRLFANRLLAHDVPHPRIAPSPDDACNSRWITKPVDGCGSEFIEIHKNYGTALTHASNQSIDLLVHQFVEGQPASIAAICQGSQTHWLPPVAQQLEAATFKYEGGSGPLPQELARRAQHLAARTLQALPENANGYVGIDLILGDTPKHDFVIEVNPRLTTSYVGLRRLMKSNLAAKMLGLDKTPLEPSDDVTHVAWQPDGTVTTSG